MEDARFSVTCEVALRLTPGRATTPVIVRAIQGSGTSWACNLPAGFRSRPHQVLVSQWRVHSGETRLAESALDYQILDCRDPDPLPDLQRDAVGRFPREMRHREIIEAGFVPIHGFTSYQARGVAFVRGPPGSNLGVAASNAMRNLGRPERDRPDILLFRPTGDSVTDAGGPDNPYRLVGWGYAMTITGAEPRGPSGAPANGARPIQGRPGLRCVPHHEWFIQAPGAYYADGTFSPGPTPAPDDDTDDTVVPFNGHRGPALWYILFFINDGQGPTISALKPGGAGPVGISVPRNAFYYPTGYD